MYLPSPMSSSKAEARYLSHQLCFCIRQAFTEQPEGTLWNTWQGIRITLVDSRSFKSQRQMRMSNPGDTHKRQARLDLNIGNAIAQRVLGLYLRGKPASSKSKILVLGIRDQCSVSATSHFSCDFRCQRQAIM